MNPWKFILATVTGATICELDGARSRKVTWRRDGPADASWSMDGRATILSDIPVAADVEELLTDLLVYRGKRLMFRGRVGASSDEIDEDSHTVSFAANDYREMLYRRQVSVIPPAVSKTYSSVDQSGIAWDLVYDTTQLTGGNVMGITRGSGQTTGVIRNRTYESGKNLGEALTELGQVINGFEWEIDPQLKFNVFYPQRGEVKDFVAEYGSTVRRVSRGVDPSEYANVVRGIGDPATTTPIIRVAADLATRIEGRFETQLADQDIKAQGTLTERADQVLERSDTIVPSYTCTLAPGVWDPETLWIGDTSKLVIRSGRLDVVTTERIEEISVAISDEGTEEVAVTYGRARRDSLARRLRSLGARLNNIERR